MILLDIATYLASTLNMTLGVDVFYEAIPSTPDLVVIVREPRDGGYIPPQLECDLRYIQVIIRDRTGSNALAIANKCHKAFIYQDADMQNEPNGLISFIDNLCSSVAVQGNPRYDDIDDKGRRLYKFNAIVATQRKY